MDFITIYGKFWPNLVSLFAGTFDLQVFFSHWVLVKPFILSSYFFVVVHVSCIFLLTLIASALMVVNKDNSVKYTLANCFPQPILAIFNVF